MERRQLLASATAAFTTSLFTGNVRGANDKVAVGFIGLGAMGSGNLGYSMKVPDIVPTAICDIYQPHLERAEAAAKKGGFQPKPVKDFRDVIADKSIDAVCISTPDHWHAYMTVEACKAGKDVYVEKPSCVYVEEGQKMVAAARKYKRIVQAGTMQRSGGYFQKAKELVKAGAAGEVTFCHAYQSGMAKKTGFGNPLDGPVPDGLDWEMWLGPAPKVPFNANRWGVKTTTFPTFRYFWDYAGGAMTDWGVHLIDPLHQCFDEVMPMSVSAMGSKFYIEDNVETPDTMLATFHYPKFIASYESRTCNPLPMFTDQGAASVINGTEATIIVNRSQCKLIPNNKSKDVQVWE
jgi:predicted dehydrogenase